MCIIRKGWFRGFENVSDLSFCKGRIDSEILEGFENLTILELHYGLENTLAPHKLVKLKLITLVDCFDLDRIKGSDETEDK